MGRIPNRIEEINGSWYTVIEDPIIARNAGKVWRQAMNFGAYEEHNHQVWCRIWLKCLDLDAQSYTRPQLNAIIAQHLQSS